MSEAQPVSPLRAPASPRAALHLIVLLSLCAASALAEWRISAISVRPMTPNPPNDRSGYRVVVTNAGSGVERRCYRDGHHFLSILNENGIFALRPHPGVDLNGWGSTLYLQPFLPGAVLRGSGISICLAGSGGIQLTATGLVSRGASEAYGTWEAALTCGYDRLAKRMSAIGRYTIQLSGALSPATGDLNLAKLASNYLDDVPLVDGTTSDTGDMTQVHVVAGTLDAIWNPSEEPGYFPNNETSNLLVDVSGAFNQVDTMALGHHAIQAAFKPSLKLVLSSDQPEIPMIFGGFYDTNKAQDFAADNVGITPLVLKRATATQFAFTVLIESTALPGDGLGVLCDVAAIGTPPISATEIYHTESLAQPFRRYVGWLDMIAPTASTGTVAIPFPPASSTPFTGFLRLIMVTH